MKAQDRQPNLFDAAPVHRQIVNRQRDRGMSRVLERTADAFAPRAEACILAQLRAGPKSGEGLTLACKLAGIVPHDDRAFGPVYMRLVRQGRIVKVGTVRRERGHGTAGGHIWATAPCGMTT